jgi:hypothetical protein
MEDPQKRKFALIKFY